jgi:hypothetical protein
MKREVREPKLVGEDHHGKTYEHPAFGQIGVHRIQGTKNLNDTDFNAHGFVRVEIYRSNVERALSRDWHHGRESIVAVDMSEAQWATFVSSFNIGMGVPCTLYTVGGEVMPELPAPKTMEPFSKDIKETVEDSLRHLRELREKLVAKKASRDVMGSVDMAIQEIEKNLPFVHQSFCERMEENVEKAKAEVHGYVNATIRQHGLDRIAELKEQGARLQDFDRARLEWKED